MSDTPFDSQDEALPELPLVEPGSRAHSQTTCQSHGQGDEPTKARSDESAAAEQDANGLGLGSAYSLIGMLTMIVVLAGLFAILRALSIPNMERWFLFATGLVLIAGWWVISVGSVDRRMQKIACCGSGKNETPADQAARLEFSARIMEFSSEVECSPEGAHFVADAIYFAPNYFAEENADSNGEILLDSSQVLLAVVRYAQEYLGEEAEARMADWGLASRDRLEYVIKSMAARDLVQLGTLGFALAFDDRKSSTELA